MKEERNIQVTTFTLSVIIPCYNEMATLQRCARDVMAIASDNLSVKIIVVDDCSTDDILAIVLIGTALDLVITKSAVNLGTTALKCESYRDRATSAIP
jgi:glycosyltransferase involved in cell wall biosynthesis